MPCSSRGRPRAWSSRPLSRSSCVALDRTARATALPQAAAPAVRVSAFAVGIAVFVGGAVLLGVEIAASRVLAPFFGNSLFVWGALIGVVLTGLAIGYWAGGVLADRFPGPGLLVGVMGLGALSVL